MSRTAWNLCVQCVLAAALGVAIALIQFHRPVSSPQIGGIREERGDKGVQAPEPARAAADERLAASMKSQKSVERWLTLLAELDTAQAADMPRLIRAAGDDPAAFNILAEHWARLDPGHLFRYIYSESLLPEGSPDFLPNSWRLSHILFDEWMNSDPAAAAKALTVAPDFRGRDDFRKMFFQRAASRDVDEALAALKTWKLNGTWIDRKRLEDWAAANPRHAAEALSTLGSGILVTEGFKAIGAAWAAGNPQAALEFAAGLSGTSRAALTEGVMNAWAKSDLTAAAASASAQEDVGLRGSWERRWFASGMTKIRPPHSRGRRSISRAGRVGHPFSSCSRGWQNVISTTRRIWLPAWRRATSKTVPWRASSPRGLERARTSERRLSNG